MDAKTLEALKKSIAHWEENVEAKTPDTVSTSAVDCALCGLFVAHGCRGCPVAEETGEIHCDGSPYDYAWEANQKWRLSNSSPEDEVVLHTSFRAAAQAEVDFLRSLLPREASS